MCNEVNVLHIAPAYLSPLDYYDRHWLRSHLVVPNVSHAEMASVPCRHVCSHGFVSCHTCFSWRENIWRGEDDWLDGDAVGGLARCPICAWSWHLCCMCQSSTAKGLILISLSLGSHPRAPETWSLRYLGQFSPNLPPFSRHSRRLSFDWTDSSF